MSLTIKEVEDLAELAKIELNQEEKEKLQKDMGGILDYIKQIEEVQVKDIKPDFSHHNVWREDESFDAPESSKEIIRSEFPDSKDGFVKVKKII